MSDLRGFNQNISVGRNTGWASMRITSDGALYVAQYALAAAIEGRLYGAHFGTVTTPLATAATTAITAQRPMVWLRVPDATAIIPVAVNILVEANGITTQGEISIAMSQNDVGNGTSSAGTSGPLPLNPAVLLTSNCTARQLSTGDSTAETNLLELKRFSFAASAVNQDFTWNAMQSYVTPVLRGPASLLVYIGGNAVNFFAQMVWIELPESAVS